MMLRRPHPGQDWKPFWGCGNFPECDGKRTTQQVDEDSDDAWWNEDDDDV